MRRSRDDLEEELPCRKLYNQNYTCSLLTSSYCGVRFVYGVRENVYLFPVFHTDACVDRPEASHPQQLSRGVP